MRILNTHTDHSGLYFTLADADVSVANALRRTMLTDIPLVVFRTSPHDRDKCKILVNTTRFNNEILKQRLACIPIHVDPHEFPYDQYMVEVNMRNDTDNLQYVTTEHFRVVHKTTGETVPVDMMREMFPPNAITHQYIDFARLLPGGEHLHLQCDLDIGTAREHGGFNAVSKCAYGNTPDRAQQESALVSLREQWRDAGRDVEMETQNWWALEAKRLFVPDHFDFVVVSECVYSNAKLVQVAARLLQRKLSVMAAQKTADVHAEHFHIEPENSSSEGSMFRVVLHREGYTYGHLLEHAMFSLFWQEQLQFCAFKLMHPHDQDGVLRIGYLRSGIDIPQVLHDVREACGHALRLIQELVHCASRL